MDVVHWHYDCPLCSEEAIRERCPAFRIEWATILPDMEGEQWTNDTTLLLKKPEEY